VYAGIVSCRYVRIRCLRCSKKVSEIIKCATKNSAHAPLDRARDFSSTLVKALQMRASTSTSNQGTPCDRGKYLNFSRQVYRFERQPVKRSKMTTYGRAMD
jgi:hypothetical protein